MNAEDPAITAELNMQSYFPEIDVLVRKVLDSGEPFTANYNVLDFQTVLEALLFFGLHYNGIFGLKKSLEVNALEMLTDMAKSCGVKWEFECPPVKP